MAPDEISPSLVADRLQRFEKDIDDRFERVEKDWGSRLDRFERQVLEKFKDLSDQIRQQSYVPTQLYKSEKETQDNTISRAHKRIDALEAWRLTVYGGAFIFLLGLVANIVIMIWRTTP